MRNNDDDGFGKIFGAFAFVWVLAALLSLGFTGVVIWAVIKLVMHFTS